MHAHTPTHTDMRARTNTDIHRCVVIDTLTMYRELGSRPETGDNTATDDVLLHDDDLSNGIELGDIYPPGDSLILHEERPSQAATLTQNAGLRRRMEVILDETRWTGIAAELLRRQIFLPFFAAKTRTLQRPLWSTR